MSSKRKREDTDDSERVPSKRVKLTNTNKSLPSCAIDIYEDVISYYRMDREPKYFNPQKLKAKLLNALQFKKNIQLLQEMNEEQDAAFDCAIWKDTMRDDIPKMIIGGMYVDVRKVIICMYAPLDVAMEHVGRKRVIFANNHATERTTDQSRTDAILRLVSHTRLVPKCDDKRCINWRHYLK